MTVAIVSNERSSIAKAAQARDKPEKPYEVRAEKPQGLLLRVQPSGGRTFYVQIGRGQRVRIGPAGTYTLKQAEEREKTTPDGEKENRAEAEPVRHNEEPSASREASGEKQQEEARMKQRPQEPILQTPSPERKQKIERDEIEPDPLRDKMSHEDWRKRDTFGHKLSASIRRTGSDIEKALKKDRAPEQQKSQPTKAPPDRKQHPNDRKESEQQKSWRDEIDKSRGKSGSEKDRGRE